MAKLVRKLSSKSNADDDSLSQALRIASLAAEHKASDIRAYDVRGMTLIADAFLICSAASEPQMKAVVNAVRKGMREMGLRPLAVEGVPSDGWIVMDYGTVICHVFRVQARAFYDLDGLWADAPQLEIEA